MKTLVKIAATSIVLVLMLFTDIPVLPVMPVMQVQLVTEAEAVFGVRRRVRRRTAVVAYSAGAATASAANAAAASSQQQTAAAQQQAAAANQEAAAAKQQLAASKAASGVAVGTVVQTLPAKCTAVTVANSEYQDCGGSFYKAAFQGNQLIYVVVDSPL